MWLRVGIRLFWLGGRRARNVCGAGGRRGRRGTFIRSDVIGRCMGVGLLCSCVSFRVVTSRLDALSAACAVQELCYHGSGRYISLHAFRAVDAQLSKWSSSSSVPPHNTLICSRFSLEHSKAPPL